MLNPPDDTSLQASGRGSRPRRVLIIDDEPNIREAIEVILDLSDVQTVSAGDGRSAVRRLGEDPASFGLVILDLTMPGLSGEETLSALRAIDRQIPIIITSGRPEHHLDPAISALSQGYLRKPFAAEGLLGLLDRFL